MRFSLVWSVHSGSAQTADMSVGVWVRIADSGEFSAEKTKGGGLQGKQPREGISAKRHKERKNFS